MVDLTVRALCLARARVDSQADAISRLVESNIGTYVFDFGVCVLDVLNINLFRFIRVVRCD